MKGNESLLVYGGSPVQRAALCEQIIADSPTRVIYRINVAKKTFKVKLPETAAKNLHRKSNAGLEKLTGLLVDILNIIMDSTLDVEYLIMIEETNCKDCYVQQAMFNRQLMKLLHISQLYNVNFVITVSEGIHEYENMAISKRLNLGTTSDN